MKRSIARCLAVFVSGGLLASCQKSSSTLTPLKTVAQVDLDRFMGDWYVIASIPTFIETDAHNAIESYQVANDGSIAVSFAFNEGGVGGAAKSYSPRAFVTDDPSNAIWEMQFLWPFKADYRITYLSEDYGQTIISREKRDYVWIMSRTPALSAQDYARLLKVVEGQGYDLRLLRKVPQQW